MRRNRIKFFTNIKELNFTTKIILHNNQLQLKSNRFILLYIDVTIKDEKLMFSHDKKDLFCSFQPFFYVNIFKLIIFARAKPCK